MYCSVCGGPVSQGLTYCNHCGARLNLAKGLGGKASSSFPESLVWAIVSVFVVGIGCLIGLMAVMKNVLNFDKDLITLIVLLTFSLIFVIEGVFIWLLINRNKFHSKTNATETTETKQLNELATKELYKAPANALAEGFVPSVVDHTTRTLEPVYREQKSES